MPERAVPPSDIAPHDFFTRWIPEVVRADERRRRQLEATRAVLQFELTDAGGAEGGLYALHIEEGDVYGRPGEAPEADLRIRLDVATWRSLNQGALSAPEAFLRRRVELRGNLRLAIKLHVIIG